MQTAGAIELGYASAALMAALLDRLVIRGVVSPTDAAGIVSDAERTINSFGALGWVPGALRVVGDVKAQLAKHGVS